MDVLPYTAILVYSVFQDICTKLKGYQLCRSFIGFRGSIHEAKTERASETAQIAPPQPLSLEAHLHQSLEIELKNLEEEAQRKGIEPEVAQEEALAIRQRYRNAQKVLQGEAA